MVVGFLGRLGSQLDIWKMARTRRTECLWSPSLTACVHYRWSRDWFVSLSKTRAPNSSSLFSLGVVTWSPLLPIPILPFRRFILTWSEPFTPLPTPSPPPRPFPAAFHPGLRLSLSLSPIDRLTMYRGGLSRVSISRIRSLPMPARSPPIASLLFFHPLYQFDLIKGERRSSLSMNFSLYELKLSSTY